MSKRFGAAMEQLLGCRSFEVLRSMEDPPITSNLICWDSREAAAADDGSTFAAFKPELKPLFVSNTTQTFEVL